MKVAIVGSRSITKYNFTTISRNIPKSASVIISGGAQGVDQIAEKFAIKQGLHFLKILPNYQKYGKKAPILRNEEIVRSADYMLAIWDFKSRGTAHSIACCIRQGVPVRILDTYGGEIKLDPRLLKY